MKKNVLTAIVSGAMVGCLAIGGTFAFLSANSGTVTNTFSGAANLDVQIRETAVDGDTYDVAMATGKTDMDAGAGFDTGWLASGESGLAYTNVVPGAEISKVVTAKVTKNVTDSYLMVTITGNTDPLTVNMATPATGYTWTEVTGHDDVYVLTNNGTPVAVDSKTADQVYNVFSSVSVSADSSVVLENIPTITVNAETVQATGNALTTADAVYTAIQAEK